VRLPLSFKGGGAYEYIPGVVFDDNVWDAGNSIDELKKEVTALLIPGRL